MKKDQQNDEHVVVAWQVVGEGRVGLLYMWLEAVIAIQRQKHRLVLEAQVLLRQGDRIRVGLCGSYLDPLSLDDSKLTRRLCILSTPSRSWICFSRLSSHLRQ